ncbi:enoyl-CoA hydratase/isomerase family protein [Arenibaculum sp.]|jgi:enoyl-CoA hydratase/carnithine racemase|uniref:enoyl-CoA hydratase/isomerase family protein n=1 Tax=Arenibaculum sp. TaxID=2865862 RepID=UPI002E0E2EAD|nr:enoyl-CoA hydratase-related protein [Arenibaculum sp.]
MNHVSYCLAGAVGRIEMHRPPANSYEISFMRDLDAAITKAEDDAGCRVVVVGSALPGFFCGGADIKQFGANEPRENIEMITLAHETLSRPARSGKIYIAEMSGHALGGGLEIALACDFRFAARGNFRFGLPEVKLGILPGNGGTQRLSALVGPNKALELMVTGATLAPEEALALGIVNRLYEADALASETRSFAEELAGAATLAIGRIKRTLHDGHAPALQAGMAAERRYIAELFVSSDAREGFAAFVERRKPQFSGT